MMRTIRRSARLIAAGLGLLGLCALGASAADQGMNDTSAQTQAAASVKDVQAMIKNWPAHSRTEARLLIAKYGAPTSYDKDSIVWENNNPWAKTVIYRKAPGSFAMYHGRDVLEQTIPYNVPSDKVADLKKFDDLLSFDKATGQLSSRSQSENVNYLALNLADEIVTGKRTPDEAKDFYNKTMKLSRAGKSSAYMSGFLFSVGGANAPAMNQNKEPSQNGETTP